MTNSLAQHTRIASFGAVMACIGDWVVLFVLGRYYPGYSQLEHSISSLGASNSPVAQWGRDQLVDHWAPCLFGLV
ncbi:MAG: hypothetical protein IPF93_11415 [Saprospiraceae bacterium]|nr:hypothetical protein [Saprospiraceae bacterium]